MATNNKLTFTFTRDFVLGDKVELFIIDAVLPVGTVSTFTWVASATSAYEVEVGTPTATAGERSAINFAQSFSTSLTGYSVTQTGNQVVLITQTLRFSSVIAKDSGDNALIIPTDYDYVIATDSGTGNKITYGDKLGLVPKGTHVNQWWDDDANEVKTKFNLNDDRIGVNEDNILLKADLNGSSSEIFKVAAAVSGDDALDKAQFDAAISNLQGSLVPQGDWNADTNTPDISTTTETGYYWIVSVAGSTNIGGITEWAVNDWAVKAATGWAKVDNTQRAPNWGEILGTLSNQTDLQNALDLKADLSGGNSFDGDQDITGNLDVTGAATATDYLLPNDYKAIGKIGGGSIPDLNTVDDVGFYKFLQTNTTLNRPQDLSYIQNIVYNSVNLLQYAHPYRASSEDIYFRSRFANVWTDWVKVLTNRNFEAGINYQTPLSNVAFTNVDNEFSVGQTITGNLSVIGAGTFGGNVTSTDFLGNWNSLGTSDFMRATGSVTETINGLKTFSAKAIFSDQIQQGTSTSSNTRAIAFGFGTISSGLSSASFGDQTTASGDASTALGTANIASGLSSFAAGYWNYARAKYETALGMFGTDYTATDTNADRIFSIGNGADASNRDDALIITRKGDCTLNGDFTTNGNISLENGTGNFKSSDGSDGGTVVALDMSTVNTITFKDGLYISHTTI